MYGALIVDPAGKDPIAYDREHVLVLSDWSFAHAHVNFTKQKQKAGYFNKRKQTFAGLAQGEDQPLSERMMWGQMLMDPTDIADVTGAYYHYLINGHDSMGNWTGIFKPGERVRLRIINAAAMSNFNIRVSRSADDDCRVGWIAAHACRNRRVPDCRCRNVGRDH